MRLEKRWDGSEKCTKNKIHGEDSIFPQNETNEWYNRNRNKPIHWGYGYTKERRNHMSKFVQGQVIVLKSDKNTRSAIVSVNQ